MLLAMVARELFALHEMYMQVWAATADVPIWVFWCARAAQPGGPWVLRFAHNLNTYIGASRTA